tara:strand:+ start:1615 stop:3801 length:2187 start_codon:yes stop_codon:yes gene_type:complete
MLIKLPIIINNKIDIINFKVIKKDNKIIVMPLDYKKDDLFKIMISNKEFCLNNFNIKFPLEIKILDNKFLFSKFFFITTLTNGFNCELNFFSNLLNEINNIFQKKYSYIDLNYLKNNITEIIKKTNIEIESRMTFEDFNDMEIYIDNQLNYTLNLVYLLLYKFPEYTTRDFKKDSVNEFIPKKILMCLNLIKNYSLKFKGSEEISINQHFDNLINNKIETRSIKKNNSYFFELNNSKVIKMKVFNIQNNLITLNSQKEIDLNSYKIFNYNPNFNSHLNFDYFIKEMIKHNYKFKLLIASKLLKKNDLDIKNILNFIYLDNKNFINLASLRNLNYIFNNLDFEQYNLKDVNLEMNILKDGDITKEYMNYLSNKYKDDVNKKIEILKILFEKYNFPLSFNKKKLNENFEMIIYFSFLNYDNFIKIVEKDKIYLDNNIIEIIPIKLKNLYFNLLKTYYQFKNESLENITYNFKFYQDYIYIYVIKNIIQDNSILSDLFDNNSLYEKLINVYKNNFILTQLIHDIKWPNLSEKLNYLEFIYKNENLIFYQNKLNKNLFNDNIDYKIKSIILDKFLMFKYLKQEKDFIKWTKFLKNYTNSLYDKKISLSNDDLVLLGKLIYKLYNLENQNLKDDKYLDLLNFCKKNKKLVMSSDNRINLLIREKFNSISCQLNLGFFAKHLNFNNDIQKIELVENKEVKEIDIKLKKMTQKYYKYKGKYMKTKTSSSSLSNFI